MTTFNNYEIHKLPIQHPEMTNLLILIVLIFASLLPIKRNIEYQGFLNKMQTDQLRGIAIIFVVLGHLWIHVSFNRPSIILSGESVAAFLLISGYGLMMSSKKDSLSFRSFFYGRFKRVIIPYWVITFFILILDYSLLRKVYPLKELMLTIFGVNITEDTHRIDYVRWYITFLLFWYIIFYFVVRWGKMRSIFSLWICATIVFFLNYYFIRLGWYHIFAFPIGCTIAQNYDTIRRSFVNNSRLFLFGALAFVGCFLVFKFALFRMPAPAIPSIILELVHEFTSILFCFCLIVIFSYLGLKSYYSPLLAYCGKISYEIFLLHGVFLIKYDPIIRQTSSVSLLLAFAAFMGFIIFFSILAQRAITNLFMGGYGRFLKHQKG